MDYQYLYEYAKMAANGLFNSVLVKMENRIANAPFDRDEILKDFSRNAVKAFESHFFVDYEENEILSIQEVASLASQWNDLIAGKDIRQYSNETDAPKGYIHNPDIFIYSQYADAILQKMIIDYCKAELMPTESKAKYAEKWYGRAHNIMQFVGIEPQFVDPTNKQAIMDFGKSRYELESTGQEFYRGWKYFDLLNVSREIKCFSKNDRYRWKQIILSIANNKYEVALWVKKQPE